MAYPHTDYTIACICPMGVELAAVRGMLDDIHSPLSTVRDQNAYVLGQIGPHSVVLAIMSEIGTNAAAVVATQLVNDFPAVRFALLVGVGGGVPGADGDDEHDIRLGDVVVSQTVGEFGGVIQYDLGKWLSDGKFERTGHLNKPPTILRSTVQLLRAQHDMEPSQMMVYLSDLFRRYPKMQEKYSMPDPRSCPDQLFLTAYPHQAGKTCVQCDVACARLRPSRSSQEPRIHYGLIGSANAVIKDAVLRDELKKDLPLLCVEMEAAGIMESFPCLIIRGVCDYADSHKNKQWQPYAAATAAAYMKELLLNIPPPSVLQMVSIKNVLVADVRTHQLLDQTVNIQRDILHNALSQSRAHEAQYRSEQEQRCHQLFKVTDYEQQKDRNPDRAEGTCQWVFRHSLFQQWHDNEFGALLWISADPGCGKSVLVKALVDRGLKRIDGDATICYFFFKDNEEQDNLSTALCAILHQLFIQQPRLLPHAVRFYQQDGDKVQRESGTLWKVLQTALADPSALSTTCVFDALDECRETDRQQLISWLCDFHRQLSSSSSMPPKLKFLITSRPYDNVSRWFGVISEDMPQIRIRGEDENDDIQREIGLVVDRKVDELGLEFSLALSTRNRLRQELHAMQHRTYLWLYLSIETIRDVFRNSLNPDAVKIGNLLPNDVQDAYEKILQRVQPEQKLYVRHILLLTVGARRALSITEMAIALTIHLDLCGLDTPEINLGHLERNIRDWCRLFVFIHDSKILLIHQTAKEFLLAAEYETVSIAGNSLSDRWRSSFSRSMLEREMARVCIRYLCLMLDLDQVNSRPAFFQYCAEHWLWHLEDNDISTDQHLLHQVLRLYDSKGPALQWWFPAMWRAFWSYKDFPRLAELPLLQDQHVAAFRGHAHMLSIFERRPDFEIEARDNRGRTVLHWAALRGHTEIVQMLLDRGVRVDARDDECDTALHHAADSGHSDVVRMLLENGADVHAQNEYGETVLHRVSLRGRVRIVPVLLDKGASVDVLDDDWRTALHNAAEMGHTEIGRLLLGGNVDINATDEYAKTALHWASLRGHTDFVELLVGAGAVLDVRDTGDATALRLAVTHEHVVIVRILLNGGADVTGEDRYGKTLLQYALKSGNKVVSALLENAGA